MADDTKKTTATVIAFSNQGAFEEIARLIDLSRLQAVKAVDTTLIDLYWSVGEYISRKIQSEG